MVMVYFTVLYKVLNQEKIGVLVGGDFLLNQCKEGQKEGYECEIKFNRLLHYFIGKDAYLITNVIFKEKKNTLCEIDSILVSRKGLFCIEVKSHRGRGFGSEKALHWKFRKNPDSKAHTHLLNPVMQNGKHCEILEKTLNFQYISYNVVVFPNACNLHHIKSDKVFTTDSFLEYYNSLKENQLTKKDILHIVDKLSDKIAIFHDFPTNKKLNEEQMSNLQLP